MLLFVGITVALALAVYCLRDHAIGKLLLLLCTVSLCFTVAEAYYRYLYARSDGFGRLSRNFARRYYQLDAYGYRASHLPLSTTQENLVVVGDSHVFGAGLKRPDERFAERLAAKYPELHVINLGLPGWDTITEERMIRQTLGAPGPRIRLIILTYFFNDIEEEVTAADHSRLGTGRDLPPTRVDRLFQFLAKYSYFIELYYYRIGYPRLVAQRLGDIRKYYADPELMQRHLITLRRLRQTVEDTYSSKLLIVTLPYLHTEELLNDTRFYARFNDNLSAEAFRFIDMQPVFAKYGTRPLVVSRFDPHTNAFANELIAQAMSSYLTADGHLPNGK